MDARELLWPDSIQNAARQSRTRGDPVFISYDPVATVAVVIVITTKENPSDGCMCLWQHSCGTWLVSDTRGPELCNPEKQISNKWLTNDSDGFPKICVNHTLVWSILNEWETRNCTDQRKMFTWNGFHIVGAEDRKTGVVADAYPYGGKRKKD
jgi:hypothetical protein